MIFVAASASPALIQTGPTAIYVMRSSNMVARSRNRWAGMLRFRSHCPACLSFRLGVSTTEPSGGQSGDLPIVIR
jgi:hypothetical protein